MRKLFLLILALVSYQVSATPLTDYPLAKLSMIGTLANPQQIWGIVKTPDDEVYRVKTASELGEEHAQVIKVTDRRITVAYPSNNGQMNVKTLWLVKPNG